ELADALLRTDLGDKARAVYQRVVEHDPKNGRAKAALAMLMPAEPVSEKGKLVQPKDAKMKVRDEAAVGGDFVDLGAMILEEEIEEPHRDTRMKVAEARELYRRVFAANIRFMDVGERVKALAKAR